MRENAERLLDPESGDTEGTQPEPSDASDQPRDRQYRPEGGAADGQASPSREQTPVEFDPFDAANPDAASDGQTVGEWLDDGPRADIGPASERFSPASVQRAQQAAERAIERQGVPPDRRSLIRRVYQRLAERSQQSNARSAPEPSNGGGSQ